MTILGGTKPTYKMGDKYIVANGCPKCGSDMNIVHQIADMCVNWQHPNVHDYFCEDGNRTCDHALMGG